MTQHELLMKPFGLSLSKPFDKLSPNGFSDSVVTRAGSIDGSSDDIAQGVKPESEFIAHPVLAGLEKVEGDGLKNLDVRRQRSWLVSRFSGSFSFFKEQQSGPDCGSPFLLLTLLLAKQKKSELPPGNPRHLCESKPHLALTPRRPFTKGKGRSATSGVDSGTDSTTSLKPRPNIPRASAAPRLTSITRLRINGPRSVMRTSTSRPLTRLCTRTQVPNGSVRWAAVKACMS